MRVRNVNLRGRTRIPSPSLPSSTRPPKDKQYKLADGGGLHLLVQPNGSKLWRLRYRFNGQENMLAFGMFPSTTIAKARAKRDEARALLASGMNPSVKRKLDKIASVTVARNTFGDVAADHLAHMEANGPPLLSGSPPDPRAITSPANHNLGV
jgi:hypothetical protein